VVHFKILPQYLYGGSQKNQEKPHSFLWPLYSIWNIPRALSSEVKGKKTQSYPCNRPWRPIGLWDVETSTFFRQSAHRWRWGCKPYAPAVLYPPGRFLVLISVRGWVDPRVIVRLEGLGQLKNPVTPIGTRTRDLPACSIVPQPTTLLHGPSELDDYDLCYVDSKLVILRNKNRIPGFSDYDLGLYT
jgi:hypothetical protein